MTNAVWKLQMRPNFFLETRLHIRLFPNLCDWFYDLPQRCPLSPYPLLFSSSSCSSSSSSLPLRAYPVRGPLYAHPVCGPLRTRRIVLYELIQSAVPCALTL